MSEKRFIVMPDANTDKILLLIDEDRRVMWSFLAEEREAVEKVCTRLNELVTKCNQLEMEKDDLEFSEKYSQNLQKGGFEMREEELKISFSDMENNVCRLELETEFPKTVLRDLYFKMMNMTDAQRIGFLKRCLDG